MSGDFTLLRGDCAGTLVSLHDKSVHLVVTSPPYGQIRKAVYSSDFDFQVIARQLHRVLCDGGVCCWNVGAETVDGSESLSPFKQAIFFVEHCGFRLHDTMIYHKTNFSNPSHNRYHQMFEYVFVFSKGAPRVFNPLRDKPNKYAGAGTYGKNTIRNADGSMGERPRNIIADFGMRGNVWTGNTRGQEEICRTLDHPAMMPKWLARDLILSFSNEGDVVLDCFAGGGTTAVQAIENGRAAIACEIGYEYCDFIERAVNEIPPLLPLRA